MLKCAKCDSNISARAPGLKCDLCKNSYHSKCEKIPKEVFKEIIEKDGDWNCSTCAKKKFNKGNNRKSLMMTNETDSSSDDVEITDDGNMGQNLLDDISDSYSGISTELKTMLNSQKTFEKSLNNFSKLVDGFNKKILKLEAKVNDIDRISADNIKLNSEIKYLKSRLTNVEQLGRMNDVEISGVTEQKNENLIQVVKSVGVAINCPFNEKDIDIVHRVECFDRKKTKNVILRCQSRILKNNIIAAARKFVNEKGAIKLSDIGLLGDNPVFVNEHLMPEKKSFLMKAKKFCKDNNIKYLWVKDCKILARKNETSSIKVINNMDDLKKV